MSSYSHYRIISRKLMSMAALLLLTACVLPRNSATTNEFVELTDARVPIVPISSYNAARGSSLFSAPLPAALSQVAVPDFRYLSAGDVLSLTILEGGVEGGMPVLPGGKVSLEEMRVDYAGNLNVPYAGTMKVAGKTVEQVRAQIQKGLSRKFSDAQVSLHLAHQQQGMVSVLGDVKKGGALPITPNMFRLSQALAAAEMDTSLSASSAAYLRRDGVSYTLYPISAVLRDASRDVILQTGDIIEVGGGSGGNVTIVGEAVEQGSITVAGPDFSALDALARAQGLNNEYADPKGVFILREGAATGENPSNGLEIYKLDMRNPAHVMAANNFAMRDNDVIYISTASFTMTRQVLQGLGSSLGLLGIAVR